MKSKKSFSCLSLSPPGPPRDSSPSPRNLDSMDSGKVGTGNDILRHKGPKMGTILEVLRCEFARPGRADQALGSDGIIPSKLWTPLHYAAYHNRESALLHFIRAGHSPDGDTDKVESPLLIAIAAGHANLVKILCAAGANVHASTPTDGESALHLAIKSGRPDITDLILSRNPDLDARTLHSRETPLHYAVAKSGSLPIVLALIKGGANNEALDSKGCSAAATAVSKSNIEAAVIIINSTRGDSKKLAKEKETLVRHVESARNRFAMNNDMIADILEAGCDPGSTVLIDAIKREDLSIAEMFLERGEDPNRPTASGLLPIFAALDCSSPQMLQLLVKYRADAAARDKKGRTLLQCALDRPLALDKDALKCVFDTLITAGADTKVTYSDGKTLLHHIVSPRIQHPKIAQRLIVSGIAVDDTDDSGCSALFYASHNRACLDILLKNNASATITDNSGLTPFFSAMKNASSESEPDLEPLMKVSNLRLLGEDKKTALHIAAERGLFRTTRLLLKYRAETTLYDSEGRTPLLLAVLHQRWPVVPLLAMQPGINSWDKAGMTALHHVVTSIPRAPATWNDIASAAAKFCDSGKVSRTLRNQKGATPLISAVMALPEEGLPVIETLLAGKGRERSSAPNNCVGHVDHKGRSALHHAVFLEKPEFVLLLLKHGAPFMLEEAARMGPSKPTGKSKDTFKLLAEHEWLQRMRQLNRESGTASPTALFPVFFPQKDMERMLALGLDPNGLPASRPNLRGSLLWVILNQLSSKVPTPPEYITDVLKLLFKYKGDPNAITIPSSIIPVQAPERVKLGRHPLTFLLQEQPDVDIGMIKLLISEGAKLTAPSPFYKGRYPLHAAVLTNRFELVEELLIRGADANVRDDLKRTPLFTAAENGYWEFSTLLLKYGALIDTTDVEGNTLLHVAAFGGSSTFVSNLLRAGAKALVKNNKGQVPSQCTPEDIEGEEKNKITKMLNGAEQREQREIEEEKRLAEQRALQEEKERKRRAEEEAARKERERQRKREAEEALKREEATRKALTSKKSTTSNRFKLSQFVPSTSSKLTLPEKKQSTGHFATALPNRTTTSLDASMTDFLNDAIKSIDQPTLAKPASAMNLSTQNKQAAVTTKALPNPRTDSGLSHISTNNKPLPKLEEMTRGRRNFTAPAGGEGGLQRSEELEGWLAVSNMLDRL